MRAGLVQMTGSDDPEGNLGPLLTAVETAVAQGADLVLTPEVTNCVSASRARQQRVLTPESADPTLTALRAVAARSGVHVLIGSLALRTDDPDGRFANRSLLIDPAGDVIARYDKIHMFDVAISETETYRESDGYRPGDRAVTVETPLGVLGLTICYDLRFPALYRRLAQAGAEILTVPSAFSPVTGAAHWEPLLRARAIETGAFVIAPAQTGEHPAAEGRARRTHGHSMVVSPWGTVLLDMGTMPGVATVDLNLDDVADARRKLPGLEHDRRILGP